MVTNWKAERPKVTRLVSSNLPRESRCGQEGTQVAGLGGKTPVQRELHFWLQHQGQLPTPLVLDWGPCKSGVPTSQGIQSLGPHDRCPQTDPAASWRGLSDRNKMRINASPSGGGEDGAARQIAMLCMNHEFLGTGQCFRLASRIQKAIHTEGAR